MCSLCLIIVDVELWFVPAAIPFISGQKIVHLTDVTYLNVPAVIIRDLPDIN